MILQATATLWRYHTGLLSISIAPEEALPKASLWGTAQKGLPAGAGSKK